MMNGDPTSIVSVAAANVIAFKDWRATRPVLLRCYRGAVPVEARNSSHNPHFFTVWHVERGSMAVTVAGRDFTARAGEWFILPPIFRKHRAEEKTELLSVHFFLERNGQPSPDLSSVLHLRGGDTSLLLSLTEQLLEGVHHHLQADASSYLPGLGCTFNGYFAVQHRFLHWLEILFGIIQSAGLLGAPQSQEDPRGKLMLKQLEETPVSGHPDLVAIAASTGLGLKQADRVFRSAHGMSMSRFHDLRRANHARQLLLDPTVTVKAAAADLGFGQLSKFSNWFHRHDQCSPREFRKRARI